MQDSNIANPRTASLAEIGPKWINKVAWFVRITGVLIVLASVAGIIQQGWPKSVRTVSSFQGFVNGTTLFVWSLIYVTRGRTRTVVTATTVVMGVSVMVFALAIPFLRRF